MTEHGVDLSLVGVVFFSWFLFPVMLKILAYTEFQIGVFMVSFAVLLMLLRYADLNRLAWCSWQKWFVFFWVVYLLFLLVATVRSDDSYSIKQYCIIIYKVMFFVILLFYMKRNFVVWSFKLYANLTVLITILACVVSVGVALEVMEPIQSMTEKAIERGMDLLVYWGAFYHQQRILNISFPLFRMQGLCEESGTFGLVVLPAFLWFLIVEKSFFRTVVIAIGLVASFSKGALLGVFLLLPLILKRFLGEGKHTGFSIVGMMGMMGMMGILMLGIYAPWYFSFNTVLTGGGRVDSIQKVYEYLLIHPFGTGNALGMITVNYPISVGYANAMLEAGVVGGIAYCAMFGLLGWKALQFSLAVDMDEKEGRVRFVVAITVLIVLFMGLQRQQPDLSLWHMWIYACFFYLTMQKKELTTEHTDHTEKARQIETRE